MNSSIDHNASAARWSLVPRRGEHFPMIAHDLGYEAAFQQFKDLRQAATARPFAELVTTTSACMWPTEMEKQARHAGGGTCLAWIEKRRGWTPSLPCACDEKQPTLNCVT